MRFLMILLFLATAASPALAATTQIVVSGEGTASAMPDMATESFTISTFAASAQSAMSENNTRYQRLTAAMERVGVAASDIQTTSYNLNYTPPPRPPETPNPGERYGYSVQRSIDVTLRSTASVGKAIDAAVAAGVTDVGGVTFGVSDRSGQTAAALKSAVQDARGQAEAIAAAAGLHITAISHIRQGFENVQPPQPMMMRTMAAPSVPTAIQPSNVQTHATVTITYQAQ